MPKWRPNVILYSFVLPHWCPSQLPYMEILLTVHNFTNNSFKNTTDFSFPNIKHTSWNPAAIFFLTVGSSSSHNALYELCKQIGYLFAPKVLRTAGKLCAHLCRKYGSLLAVASLKKFDILFIIVSDVTSPFQSIKRHFTYSTNAIIFLQNE